MINFLKSYFMFTDFLINNWQICGLLRKMHELVIFSQLPFRESNKMAEVSTSIRTAVLVRFFRVFSNVEIVGPTLIGPAHVR